MTRQEFICELEFIFSKPEGSLNDETELGSIPAWDSIGQLSVITLMKEAGAKTKVNELLKSKTVGDLINLAADTLQ